MRWLVLALLVGCTPSPEQEVSDVCNAFCDCEATTPATHATCVANCTQLIAPVTDACVQCVDSFEATCTGLVATCQNECIPQATPDTKGSR